MSRNLNQEEKEKLRDKYEEHIFFRLANQSCKKYEREMKYFRFSPEDVFMEVLNVLDDLKAPNKNNDDLCDTLWDDLFCVFRERGENIPDEELDKAVAIVVSMVSICLTLLESIKYNGVNAKLILSLSQNYKEYRDILFSIQPYTNKVGIIELKEWLVGYMTCDTYMYDEVMDYLEEKNEKVEVAKVSSYRIAEKHKTNFAKIISAMYDLRMFEDETGKVVSNKQKLMDALGGFFGIDYKNLSQLLNAAKQNGNYTEIFEKLKERAEKFNQK